MIQGMLDRCQILVGQMTTDPSRVLEGLSDLTEQLPSTLSPASQLLFCTVLARCLSRFAAQLGIAGHVEVAAGFVRVAASTDALDRWRDEFAGLISVCSVALKASDFQIQSTQPRHDTSVRRVLLLLDAHHANPNLTLKDAARAAGCSLWHTSRTLKEQTGLTFTFHVQRRRVFAAQQLLERSSLTMKEIAAAAGFRDARRFSERFKQLTGETPTAFRRRSLGSC
jgi:AraC-like DNA-binding protein